MSHVALVACSDPRPMAMKPDIESLVDLLQGEGLSVEVSPCLFDGAEYTPENRAKALIAYFTDPTIDKIFDISGGDLANEVLPFLDYPAISKSTAVYYGWSDNTTVMNAVYTKTGKPTVNYQIMNLMRNSEGIAYFRQHIIKNTVTVSDLEARFIRGTSLEGIAVGGNIRCLLKLAGTEYWPDMKGKILLLESLGGRVSQMQTALTQLSQMGVFEQISGLLLGTFTTMEEEQCVPSIEDLVLAATPNDLPVAKTRYIGHGKDARGIVLGRKIGLYRDDSDCDDFPNKRRSGEIFRK